MDDLPRLGPLVPLFPPLHLHVIHSDFTQEPTSRHDMMILLAHCIPDIPKLIYLPEFAIVLSHESGHK